MPPTKKKKKSLIFFTYLSESTFKKVAMTSRDRGTVEGVALVSWRAISAAIFWLRNSRQARMNTSLCSTIFSCSHFSRLRNSRREASAARSIAKKKGCTSKMRERTYEGLGNTRHGNLETDLELVGDIQDTGQTGGITGVHFEDVGNDEFRADLPEFCQRQGATGIPAEIQQQEAAQQFLLVGGFGRLAETEMLFSSMCSTVSIYLPTALNPETRAHGVC